MGTETTSAEDVVVFDAVEPADVLMIRTHNSLYEFTATDPGHYVGLMTGGVLGGTPAEVCCMSSHLNVGSQAVFLVDSSGNASYLRTSNITALTHVKGS